MNEYLEPEEKQGNRNKEKRGTPSTKPGGTLEKKGPNKGIDPKVLNKDGSFPDKPYNNQPGGGALEGTVGIGT